MSAHYNLEPPPTATVLLHTTAGPITLSLFASQTPLTCRNFLQHCLDGTYNGLPFHRVAAGFVIQTGDPTGTGEGGQNIYEDREFERYDEAWARLLGREEGEKIVFGDEVHSRLKFGRRGLLGMAKDAGGGGLLRRKGKVKKPVKKGKKAKAVLSFGDEEEGDVLVKPKKAKFNTALIDGPTVGDAPKANGLAKEPADATVRRRSPSPRPTIPAKRKAFTTSDAHSPHNHRKPSSPDPATQLPSEIPKHPPAHPPPLALPRHIHTTAAPPQPNPKQHSNPEIAALKASMRRPTTNTVADISHKQSALEALIPASSTKGRKRPRPGESSKEDAKALKMLNAFRSRLEAADNTFSAGKGKEKRRKETHSNGAAAAEDGVVVPTAPTGNADDAEDGEAKLCDLHFIANCQSCFAAEAAERGGASGIGADGDGGHGEEEDNDRTFLSHSLNFARDRLGKDLEWRKKERNRTEDDDGGLVVIDPRAKARDILGGKVKGREKGKEREWDRGSR